MLSVVVDLEAAASVGAIASFFASVGVGVAVAVIVVAAVVAEEKQCS